MANGQNSSSKPYNPSEHTVSEVQQHLESVEDKEEFDRIIAVEQEGKARSGILSYEWEEDEPDQNGDGDGSGAKEEDSQGASDEDGDTGDSGAEDGDSESGESESSGEAQKEAVDGKVEEGYDPYRDPVVPSTSLAQHVAKELKSGESATLKALRERAG